MVNHNSHPSPAHQVPVPSHQIPDTQRNAASRQAPAQPHLTPPAAMPHQPQPGPAGPPAPEDLAHARPEQQPRQDSDDNTAWPPPGHTPLPAHNIDQTAWSTESAEKTGPRQGWRGGLAKIGVRLPKSAKEVAYDRDVLRMQRKVAYPHNIVVVGLKGGVGKSTITIGIGSTLASHRHVSDVVAVDTDTDGSLQQRMPKERNQAVASDIKRFLRSINDRPLSGSEIQVRLYSNSNKLQALVAAEHVNDYALNAQDYTDILSTLHNEYMVNLIDTSPDRRVPTFVPAIHSADVIVLVTIPNADSIDKAARFLETLRSTGKEDLLTRTVLIWNSAAPGDYDRPFSEERAKNEFVQQLSTDNDPSSCLIDIPLDPHLAAGGEVNLSLLRKQTRRQFERAAALVMDKLPDRTSYR